MASEVDAHKSPFPMVPTSWAFIMFTTGVHLTAYSMSTWAGADTKVLSAYYLRRTLEVPLYFKVINIFLLISGAISNIQFLTKFVIGGRSLSWVTRLCFLLSAGMRDCEQYSCAFLMHSLRGCIVLYVVQVYLAITWGVPLERSMAQLANPDAALAPSLLEQLSTWHLVNIVIGFILMGAHTIAALGFKPKPKNA
eukprot:TRINITY_DN5183_c0_g1_i2.p1 TRINITY_DN5183_c0_g1~~TRINITY_DN5183_c0_g1_i2.p1  ORF type:complete len:195 (+),score=22.23 TRINITY_DN5183_c0_g1_i2:109-693(+)